MSNKKGTRYGGSHLFGRQPDKKLLHKDKANKKEEVLGIPS